MINYCSTQIDGRAQYLAAAFGGRCFYFGSFGCFAVELAFSILKIEIHSISDYVGVESQRDAILNSLASYMMDWAQRLLSQETVGAKGVGRLHVAGA